MRKLMALALLIATTSGSQVLAQQVAPGTGASAELSQRQAECRRQADDKGLRGPSQRQKRQEFMQSCVHGK
ncbi:hypothetical protein WDZ92_24070 [Nostoc sp. NIES-2111]